MKKSVFFIWALLCCAVVFNSCSNDEPDIGVGSVTITAPGVSAISPNEVLQLTATVSPDNATEKSVVWQSLDPTVATIDQTGLVTGVSVGTTTIRVSTGQATDELVLSVVVVPDGWEVNGNTATYGKLEVIFEKGVCKTVHFTTITGSSSETDIEAVFPESVLDTFTISGSTMATIDLMLVAGCKEYFENLSMAQMFAKFNGNTLAILTTWTESFSVTNLVTGCWEMPSINILEYQTSNDKVFSVLREVTVAITYSDISGSPMKTMWHRKYDSAESLTQSFEGAKREILVKIIECWLKLGVREREQNFFIIDVTELYPEESASSKGVVLQQDPDAKLFGMATTINTGVKE